MKKILDNLRRRNLVPILIIYYMVGVTGIVLPVTREIFLELFPLTLILSIALLFVFHGPTTPRFWIVGLVIFLAGFLLEVVGVATGLLFGTYSYGPTLGPKLFHTPLMIGVNWLMLVYCSSVIAGRFVEPLYFRSLTAGALMVVYDFALEPVAMRLHMWDWEGGIVPLQNYIAWFVIAVILNFVAGAFRMPNPKNKLAGPLFFIQLGFFIALNFWIIYEKVWA